MSIPNTITRSKTSLKSKTTDSQDRLVSAIQLWGLILLTLHLAATSLPPEISWGIWPYTFLPTWLGWLLALLVGALIIPPVSRGTWNLGCRGWVHLTRHIPRPAFYIIISLIAGLIFWLARLRHLRWGDGYLLSVALAYPDPDIRVIYNWQAPLTVFLHQRLWQFVADPLWGWSVDMVYAAISIGCGMLFVYVLLLFTQRLGRDSIEQFILVGLLLTTGTMQLFFGYVENYTIVSLMLLLTLFLGWRALQGEIQPVWPVLGLATANAFHPSSVFIWPGMWLLSYLCWKRHWVSLNGVVWQTVLPPLLIGSGLLALMEQGGHGLSAFLGVDRPGGGDGIWFVPLFETTTEWQHYTMFSVGHVLDWANLQLLVSPFGLPLLVMVGVAWYRFSLVLLPGQEERDFALFLSVTAGLYVLFTWLWNADYGLQKDWDLFSPAALLYTLLAAYLLVRALSSRVMLQQAGLFIVAVSLLHTAAWIFTNTHNLPRQ